MSDIEPTSRPEPALRLTITPEPTEDEAAAIAAALATLSIAAQEPASSASTPRRSPWLMSGRLAAHHAAPSARQRRWSRALAWLGNGR